MIVVTGATGHVGGRLLRALEREGREVRAAVRTPEKLDAAEGTEVVRADVLDDASLREALAGAETAYYLVHSLGSGGSFGEEELRAARTFGAAAREAGVGTLVYLGGLVHEDTAVVSDHMASRLAVGEALREHVPTVELRASIVIGAGSLSFETIRMLVDTLPVLTLPSWVDNRCQPIAADDVVAYLVEAADAEAGVYEIGGADRVTYREVMEEYARRAGLERRFVTVPAPPRLLSLSDLPEVLTGLAPEQALAAAQLVESLEHDSVVRDERAREAFSVEPVGLEEAVRRALE
ncbi:MAG TPA: NAD(P)H-binding protein [Gaiellaceae bacterium]|nr:NAD(P)H-binding protein [Gaiellaceae bacterium]